MNWIAFVLISVGNLLVGDDKKSGFVWIGIGSIIWMAIGFKIKDYALVATNIVGTIVMVRNWLKWRKTKKTVYQAP